MTGAPGEPRGGTPGGARYLGFGLLALAPLMWVLVPGTLLLSLPAGQKGWTTAALLVGREVVRRYRSYLDPRRLLRRQVR